MTVKPNYARTKQVRHALIQGVDPTTGKELPSDSIVNNMEVNRAVAHSSIRCPQRQYAPDFYVEQYYPLMSARRGHQRKSSCSAMTSAVESRSRSVKRIGCVSSGVQGTAGYYLARSGHRIPKPETLHCWLDRNGAAPRWIVSKR